MKKGIHIPDYLQESTTFWVIVTEMGGVVLYSNPFAKHCLGLDDMHPLLFSSLFIEPEPSIVIDKLSTFDNINKRIKLDGVVRTKRAPWGEAAQWEVSVAEDIGGKVIFVGHPSAFEAEKGTFLSVQKNVESNKGPIEKNSTFSNLMSSLPGYVYRVANDKDYTPLYISDQVEEITGYSQSEYLVDRTISCGKEIHPDDALTVWDNVQHAIDQKKEYECEYRIITKKGEVKWVWERGQGNWDNDGNLLFLQGFVTDITDKKLMMNHLDSERNRLDYILKNTNIGTWEWDSLTLEAKFDNRWEAILGYMPEPFSLRSLYKWQALVHPDDWAESKSILEAHFAGRLDAFDIEWRVKHSNGDWVWVFIQGKVVSRTTEGKPRVILGTYQDISKRKMNEAAWRESEAKFKSMIDFAPIPFAINDDSRNIIYVNESFIKLFGYDLSDISSLDAWWQKAYPDEVYRNWVKEEWDERLKNSKTEGTAFEFLEVTIRCKFGAEKLVQVGAVPLGGAQKGTDLITFIDITLQRQMAEEIKALIHANPDMMFVFDDKGYYIDYFAKEHQLYAPKDAIVGKHITETMPEHISQWVLESMKKVLSNESEVESLEYGLKFPNKECFYVARIVKLTSKTALVIVSDITTRKETERLVQLQNEALLAKEEELMTHIDELNKTKDELIAQNQHISAIFNALEDSAIVTITDTKGKILKANSKFCSLSKYTEQELLGQDHRIVNSGYHGKQFWIDMWQTIGKGKIWQGEVCNRAKDGSIYWVYSINNPILSSDGKIASYLSIRFDITEKKRAEEKLVMQNRILNEIGYEQSHTLRRPLASMLGLLDLINLEKNRGNLSNLFEYLGYLENAAKETDNVIRRIVEKTNSL